MPLLPSNTSSDRTKRIQDQMRYADALIQRQNFDAGITNQIRYESGSGANYADSLRIHLLQGIAATTLEQQQFILSNNTPQSVTISPSYTVTQDVTTVNEGQSVTFTITTANVSDGVTLYWTISGTAVNTDFTDDAGDGSITVNSNTASLIRTIKSDLTTEGSETFQLQIRTESISGTIVATSSTITINDTSTAGFYTWNLQSSSPTMAYSRLAVTSDFTTQITTRGSILSGQQGPYISTDSGATWTRKVTGMTFLTNGASYTIDCDVAKADGTIMYCANRRMFVSTLPSTFDKIYKSTDTGDNWTAISPADSTWQSIACSEDGSVIIAGNSNSGDVSYDRKFAISTDGGSTWSAGSITGQWTDVALSADGTRMYAVNTGVASLYRSSNTGSTWSTTSTTVAVRSVACSADGLTVLIGRGGSSTPMVSTDGGVTFTAITSLPTGFWDFVSVSDDGLTMAAARTAVTSQIYTSRDGGVNWVLESTSPTITWGSLDINFDGSRIAAGGTSSQLYVGVA